MYCIFITHGLQVGQRSVQRATSDSALHVRRRVVVDHVLVVQLVQRGVAPLGDQSVERHGHVHSLGSSPGAGERAGLAVAAARSSWCYHIKLA